LLLLWLLPTLASAQEVDLSREEVREYEKRLQRGAELFGDEDYSGARAELKRAYKIYPNPTILFSIAGTYKRQDRNTKAVEAYRRFLDACVEVVCKNENKEQIALAEATIEELGLDEGDEPIDPPEDEDEPDPDSETLSVSDESPARPGAALRWSGVAVGALGIAALGFAGYDQLKARSLEQEIEDALAANGSTWTPQLAAKEEEGNNRQKRARISAIGGGLALVVGVSLFVYGQSKGRKDSVAIVPMGAGRGTGVVLSGAF